MQSPLTSITLKPNYDFGLYYTVYNGPPQTIVEKYNLNKLYTEYDLLAAVKRCDRFIKYINNPSEDIICAHIESHGTLFYEPPRPSTRKMAIAIIKNKPEQFDNYNKSYQFSDTEINDMCESNSYILKHVNNQSFDLCVRMMNKIIRRNDGRHYTELFYGGSSIWHKSIDAKFAECINCDVLTHDEIHKLYDILYSYNEQCIGYMNPKFIKKDMIYKYIENNRYSSYLLAGLNLKDTILTKEEKTEIYDQAFIRSILNFEYIEPEFQTKEMLCKYIEKYPKYLTSQKFQDTKLTREEKQEICDRAFTHSILNFEYIDHEYQSDDMIDKVFKCEASHAVRLYKYIKSDKFVNEMYQTSFKRDPDCFQYIPDNLKTSDMCHVSVNHSLSNIAFVPTHLQTPDMCIMAANDHYEFIKYCEYINIDMLNNVQRQRIKESKRKRYDFINELKEHQLIQVMKIMPHLIRALHNHNLTPNVIKAALETNGYVIEYVSTSMLTDEYTHIALQQQPLAKKYIENRNKKS